MLDCVVDIDHHFLLSLIEPNIRMCPSMDKYFVHYDVAEEDSDIKSLEYLLRCARKESERLRLDANAAAFLCAFELYLAQSSIHLLQH